MTIDLVFVLVVDFHLVLRWLLRYVSVQWMRPDRVQRQQLPYPDRGMWTGNCLRATGEVLGRIPFWMFMRCPMYPRPHRFCPESELRVQVPSVSKWIPSLSVGPCAQSSGWRTTTEINMEGSHSCSLSTGRNMPEGFCFYYLTSIFSLRSAQNRKRLITLNGSVQGLTVLRGLLC